MAKKEEKTAKVILERVYTIPLRREFLKVAKYRRSKKAATAARMFLERHMKSEQVKLGKFLNLEIWKHGIKNPPHHVKVNAVKTEDGVVRAELFGAPKEEPKKEAPKKGTEKKPEAKKETPKPEQKKDAEAKVIEKEELKELEKEKQKVPEATKKPKEAGHKQDHAVKAPKAEQHISRDEHQLKSTK